MAWGHQRTLGSLTCHATVCGWTLCVLLASSAAPEKEVDYHHFRPRLYGTSRTRAGIFQVWQFPLEFDSYIFYMRRFGVDVPRECEVGQPAAPCPVLVDFHGSSDSLYSQRAWTKWFRYLEQAKAKFILLTPEGSPDAVYTPSDILNDCNDTSDSCVGTSQTSWNVLGWGELWHPMDQNCSCGQKHRKESAHANCFFSTLRPDDAYQCFGTHLVMNPDVCRHTTSGWTEQIPTVCMSATGANDMDYITRVLRFVLRHYGADSNRIYFTGQSMGGMASLQFATPEGKQALPRDLQPAAIAACSAGASRSSWAELRGKVPTLLLWGYGDHISPPTIWSGLDRNLSGLTNSSEFSLLLGNGSLIQEALKVTGGVPHTACRAATCSCLECCALLQANAMTGGSLLRQTLVQQLFMEHGKLGCENKLKELTSIGDSGFLWEGVFSTLQGVAGHHVDMTQLSWQAPASVPPAARDVIDLRCAEVPPRRRRKAEVHVCIFNGGHNMPWNGNPTTSKGNDWMDVAGPHGKVFHDFVWENFFREGAVFRECDRADGPCGSTRRPFDPGTFV